MRALVKLPTDLYFNEDLRGHNYSYRLARMDARLFRLAPFDSHLYKCYCVLWFYLAAEDGGILSDTYRIAPRDWRDFGLAREIIQKYEDEGLSDTMDQLCFPLGAVTGNLVDYRDLRRLIEQGILGPTFMEASGAFYEFMRHDAASGRRFWTFLQNYIDAHWRFETVSEAEFTHWLVEGAAKMGADKAEDARGDAPGR